MSLTLVPPTDRPAVPWVQTTPDDREHLARCLGCGGFVRRPRWPDETIEDVALALEEHRECEPCS